MNASKTVEKEIRLQRLIKRVSCKSREREDKKDWRGKSLKTQLWNIIIDKRSNGIALFKL